MKVLTVRVVYASRDIGSQSFELTNFFGNSASIQPLKYYFDNSATTTL